MDKDGYVQKEGERNRKNWVLSCSVCWLWNGMEGEDPEEMKTMFLEWLVVAPPHGKGSSSNVLISDGLRKMSNNCCADMLVDGT